MPSHSQTFPPCLQWEMSGQGICVRVSGSERCGWQHRVKRRQRGHEPAYLTAHPTLDEPLSPAEKTRMWTQVRFAALCLGSLSHAGLLVL